MPPVRIELTTPGLRDQCSTTELKRPVSTPGASYLPERQIRFDQVQEMYLFQSVVLCYKKVLDWSLKAPVAQSVSARYL